MQNTGKAYIAGAWQAGSAAPFESHNPATGERVWQGNAADAADISSAVTAAEGAFDHWSALRVSERIAIIEAFGALIDEHLDALAAVISAETGKVTWDALGEAKAVKGKIAISLAAYRERTGKTVKEADGLTNILSHKPHGVMAIYGPYNFPAHLPNGHMVPALIAGNCVILKPSDYTPAVSEFIMQLWEQAGIPDGVVQLVQGGRETGIALAAADGINGVLFTGSEATGTALHKQFAGRLDVMLALELGGNNPLIIWDTGNAAGAAYIALQSAFITTGQRCTCARRLILPEGKAGDEVLACLIEAAAKLVVGKAGSRPEPFMGPLVHEKEAQRLLDAQEKLIDAGGVSLLKMQQLEQGAAFVSPGIIDVSSHSPHPNPLPGGEGILCRRDEEYFGPLLQVIRVADFDAAIVEANNTRFGLSAGLTSDNEELIVTFKQRIRAGVVAINRPTAGASGAMPFGGIGASGNHHPSAYYAADYCAYPVACQESAAARLPTAKLPGVVW